MPAICTGLLVSSWLTSGSIFMLIRPPPSTVGVKARPTPYFLNSMAIWPSAPGTGTGNSPPARKLAVSPDSATRFGSASERATPFSSSALISDWISRPFMIMREIRKPNGAVPDSTPPTTTGDNVTACGLMFGPPTSESRLLERVARARGRDRQAARTLLRADVAVELLAERVPLHAELAAGLAGGLDEAHLQHDLLRRQHLDRVDDVGPELPGDRHRAVERHRVRRRAGEHDAAVDRSHAQLGVGEALADLVLQQRSVVDHLDVEHADQLLAFGIDRHARGAVLLAEDRQRAIGQRIDVRHLRIADRDLDEAGVGAHVLGLADEHRHRERARGPADLQRALRLRFAPPPGRHRARASRSAPPRAASRIFGRQLCGRRPVVAVFGLLSDGVRPLAANRDAFHFFTSNSPPICPTFPVT